MFQDVVSDGVAEGQQLAFQEFASLAYRFSCEVTRLGVGQVRFNRFFDRGNVGWVFAALAGGFPIVIHLHRRSPLAPLEAHLHPPGGARSVRPDGAGTAGPPTTLRTMPTVARMKTIKAQASGGHNRRIAPMSGISLFQFYS